MSTKNTIHADKKADLRRLSVKISYKSVKISKLRKSKYFNLIIGAILVLLVPLAIVLTQRPEKAGAAWMDEQWFYRQTVALTNSSGSNQTDFQISFTLNTQTLISAGKMQSNCNDIRLTDVTGKPLPYWIESGTNACNTSTTAIWTKIPSLPTSGALIYLYYGNPSAPRYQNGDNVFLFFDDLENGNLNKWSNIAQINATISNDYAHSGTYSIKLNDTNGAGNGVNIRHATNLSLNKVTLDYWLYIRDSGGNDYPDVYFYNVNGQSIGLLRVDENLNIKWYDGSLNDTGYDATRDTWIKFTVKIDTTSNSVNILKDNSSIYTGTLQTSGANYQYFFFDTESNGTVLYYADDITIRKYASTEPSASSGSEEKGPGPVAYWGFNEGQGTSTNDSSSNKNTGTISGASWQTEDQCVSGKCLKFDGTDDYVLTSSITQIGTAYTVDAWVRPVNTFAKGCSDSCMTIFNRGTIYLALDTNGKLELYNGDAWYKSNTSLEIGKYYYVSVSGNSSNINLYINGKLDKNYAISAGTLSSGTVYIGARADAISAAYNFNGFIDEPKIYNYARSAAQIRTDYNARGASKGISADIRSQSAKILSDGLVGYWKMDEASANTCTGGVNDSCDSSGNSNNGAWNGDATSAAGKFGNGVTFDGTGDYISVNDNNVLRVGPTWTAGVWIYPTLTTGARIILYKSNSLALRINNGTLEVAGGNWFAWTSTGVSISTNTWTHLGVSVTSSGNNNVNIFKDGALVSSLTKDAGAAMLFYKLGIGAGTDDDTNFAGFFTGQIDEVRVYNRALSPAEVSQLYDWAPGPVGYWKMDDKVKGASKTLTDDSGNGNNGTTSSANGTGMDCISKPGKYGGGCNFDGTDDYAQVAHSSTLVPGQLRNGTFEAWIYNKGDTSNYQNIILKGTSTFPYQLYLLDNSLNLGFASNAGVADSTIAVSTNQWVHVAATVSNTTVNFYINGVLRATGTGQIDTDNGEVLLIGGRPSSTNPFNGLIDDVKIYNYARTQAQIQEDMAGTSALIRSSSSRIPLSHWDFDEGYSTTANNRGSQGSTLNGTLTSMASPATSTSGWTQSGKFGKGLIFDGSDDRVRVQNGPTLSSYSISGWIKPNTISSDNVDYTILGSNGWSTNGQFGIYLRRNDGQNINRQLAFNVYGESPDTAGTYPTGYSIAQFPTTTYSYFIFTYDSTTKTQKLYVNGVLDRQNTFTTRADILLSDFFIGSWYVNSAYRPFNGSLDEVKVYSYALTKEEILADYNSGSSLILGSLSSNSSYPSNSSAQEYCIPGDSTSCAAPVGRWDFEEGNGGSVYDSSGSGNTLTLNSSVWTTGKFGKAISYNGSSGYLSSTGSSTSLTGNMTVSTWVKPSNTTAGVVMDSESSYFIGYSNVASIGSANKYNCGWYDTAGATWRSVPSTTSIVSGNWFYVTCSISGTTMSIYINDNLENTGIFSGTRGAQNTHFWVGGTGTASQYFAGVVDGLRVYNYARSAAQVAWDYNRGKPVGWWKMNECQGTTINDASGNGNNGTLTVGASGTQTAIGTCNTSGTAWGNGVTGKRNYSLNFDGTDDYLSITDSTNSPLDITGDLSISAWIKANSNSGIILSKSDSGGSARNYQVGAHPNGFQFCPSWAECDYSNSGDVKTDGSWQHIVISFDNTNDQTKFYIDGKLVDTETTTSSLSANNEALNIGSYGGGAGSFFNGQIDEVKIYNYALTGAQVKDLYNNGAVNFSPVTGAP